MGRDLIDHPRIRIDPADAPFVTSEIYPLNDAGTRAAIFSGHLPGSGRPAERATHKGPGGGQSPVGGPLRAVGALRAATPTNQQAASGHRESPARHRVPREAPGWIRHTAPSSPPRAETEALAPAPVAGGSPQGIGDHPALRQASPMAGVLGVLRLVCVASFDPHPGPPPARGREKSGCSGCHLPVPSPWQGKVRMGVERCARRQ